jgi:site-specific DNA-methyltransferase (adenine-specific)
MSKDAWVVLFCAVQHYQWLNDELKKNGFTPDSIPAIWNKQGTTGQCNCPTTWFSRTYETFVYAYRGEATLVQQGKPNVLNFPVVHTMDKDHPVEKPVALLEEIISRFCFIGSVILDFMCGSGSTLVAAIRRGCNPIGFELNEKHYNTSIINLSEALKMKDAGELDKLAK